MEWKLKDLTVDGKGSYGIGASAVPYQEDKLTYLRITDINDDGSLNFSDLKSVDAEDAEKYILKENDIVFARTGNSTGRSYFYEKQHGTFVYAGFLIKFSLDPNKVNPRILKYYTHSKPYYDWVSSFDTGATRGNINAKTYGDMEIELPSRKIQNRIVSILSSLDRKIELNNKINADLEEMAQAIFKNWFVDFEPFKDGKFVDSELGMIPEGWKVVVFDNILKVTTTKTGKEGISEYSVTNTGIHPRDEKFTKNLSKSSAKNKLIRKGNLVFGMSREILNWGIMKEEVGGVSSAYNVYLVDEKIVNTTYLECFIAQRMDYFADLIKPASREGQGVDKALLMKKIICIPPSEVMDVFLEKYNSIMHLTEIRNQESSRLSLLRDTLLPRLMSGEQEVPE